MPKNEIYKLYSGFNITEPVGNNSFSFEKRENPSLYVAPLIKGSVDDLSVGEKVAFSEYYENEQVDNLGLKQFVQTQYMDKDVFIFDNHNHALFFWAQAVQFGSVKSGLNLIHVDQHKDMRKPEIHIDLKGSNLDDIFKYVNFDLNVGNFVDPAIVSGLVSEVYIVDSQESFQRDYGDGFILDIDVDVFSSEMDYIDYDLKMAKIQKWMKQASLITIATSPYFMDQQKAISIIQDLFS